MALNVQVWQHTLVEGFYPNDSFAAKSVDDSSYVNAKIVHVPNAGAAPNVEVNRSTLPADVKERKDFDLEYQIDELTTDPVRISNADSMELSYDKRNSVLAQCKMEIQRVACQNLLYKWAEGVKSGNVIVTTGEERTAHTSDTATGKRLAITKTDVLKVRKAMSKDNIPQEGRYMLLDSEMYSDLLADLTESDRIGFFASANAQEGILGKLYGINIMERSEVLRLKADKTLLKWHETAVAGELAAGLAWHTQSVSRAMGDVKMFENYNNPQFYSDIYSFLLRTGGAVRRYDKKGIYLIAEASKA